MSKEQTPIDELVIKLAELYTDLGNAKKPDQGMKLVSTITKEIEQFTQAKVLEALEREDVKIYTGLRDLNGDRIYRGDVVQNEVEERGSVMYWDGAFCVSYFDEPAKEYLHTLTITDKNYCSTGKVKLTKITKQK